VTCREETPFELVACSGNVCPENGRPFVQAHGVLTNEHGKIIAGRLFSDTILLAGELDLQELKGKALQRAYDHETGLLLWHLKEH
jgi:predicted DNA-binding protein with PD1-like motif